MQSNGLIKLNEQFPHVEKNCVNKLVFKWVADSFNWLLVFKHIALKTEDAFKTTTW